MKTQRFIIFVRGKITNQRKQMRYIEGFQRTQAIMFPETLDEYVSADNVVRFIDNFVDSLDMTDLGFKYSIPKETGRKPYNPGDMLKLYIYGYLRKIRSSRQMEAETQRNIELMWLMNKLSPDFKTISDFRKDNTDSIKKVSKEFIVLCKKLNLYSNELVSIDGSKFRAVNSQDNNYSRNRLNIILESIDKEITSYLREIERTDSEEIKTKKLNKTDLDRIIHELEKSKSEVKLMLKEIEDGSTTQISLTDPESRMMRTRDGNQVSYNVQVVADNLNHLIVDFEVTNDQNDLNSLSMMASKAKEILGVEELNVVCDTGYFNKEEIVECESNNISCYIPQPKRSSNENEGRYKFAEFIYNTEENNYTCPVGNKLLFVSKINKHGLNHSRYRCKSCSVCPVKAECTSSKGNRYIDRYENEAVIESMLQRLSKNRSIMGKRKSTIEHIFGTLKHWDNFKHFLMIGKEKVSCEMSLAVLSYNLRRVVNIIGVRGLLHAI